MEADLQKELSFHLEQETSRLIALGWDSEEARRQARLAIGGPEQVKEQCRDARGTRWLEDFLQDGHYALRTFRQNPGFTWIALLTLALGIGANTAVFSVVNAVILKPLSYRDPDRIVTLSNSSTAREAPTTLSKQVSIPDVQDWRDSSLSFEALTYYASHETAVIVGSSAEYARVTSVSPDFFRVFAVEPFLGRAFTMEETKPGGAGAAMISYTYWQSHFGGDPYALGQIVRVDGPRPIVGVLPLGFRFPNNTDIWMSEVGPPGSRGDETFSHSVG